MSFFSKRKSMFKKDEIQKISIEKPETSSPSNQASANSNKYTHSTSHSTSKTASKHETAADLNKIFFNCQLAHGSPTRQITGFSNAKELYNKLANCFNIPESAIIFCTLNTHRVDMDKLLSGQLGLDDLIFVHMKGKPKEVEIVKNEVILGLTITDNGAGSAFIKKIKPESTCDRLGNILAIGDHIEAINGRNILGIRHFEVAKILQDIPLGESFKMRLLEPIAYAFPFESPKRNSGKPGDIKYGNKTLRFKADGVATIEDVDDHMSKAVERINVLLDTYMGINDSELSQQIWELSQQTTNPSDFATAIDESELGSFNFSDEFIFDLWATIDDAKVGRTVKQQVINERF